VEIYYAVRRLAEMLDIDFCYLIPQKRLNGLQPYPEIQLMSLIVIATKLSQPFDDIVRHPQSDVDPTIMKIQWSKWRDIMAESSSGGSNGENIILRDEDVFGMSEKKMDDYMDWFQRTWIDDRESKGLLVRSLTFHLWC
jgi:RNA polymerase I-specific transcription initiation factor RRN7